MGLVEPPWVDKEFFESVPFNYCDHFGDREELAIMCKVCKEDIEWREKLIREGRDPDSWDEVFKEVGKNLGMAMVMIQKQAEEMGIDLSKVEGHPDPREIQARRYSIYRIVEKYGNKVGNIMKDLEYVPKETNADLFGKAMEALSHSHTYAQVKIHRALASRKEEKTDEIFAEVGDSKTSALLAYLAIERNSRVLFRLSNHKPLWHLRRKLLKLSKLSLETAELIQTEFYPNSRFKIDEFGCDSYNIIFKKISTKNAYWKH